jgi:circadian clock protein KaiC
MTNETGVPRVETGIKNLDAILRGGLPKGSVTVISGPPGSGKTILAQQICFHNATPGACALYFGTLSEPTAKTLRYLGQFGFFDPAKLVESVHFIDLGALLRTNALDEVTALFMQHVRELKPALVVVDSFKVFDDLARSPGELRRFGYELAVSLMAWEATALLLGEYGPGDVDTNPLFSIVDGLVAISRREVSGEQQRVLQVLKMRGSAHSLDEHALEITSSGIEIFAPRLTTARGGAATPGARMKTGILKLDDLLGEGVPRGSSLLVGGVAGTGKTILLLEIVYRGALAGEKGVFVSFEETREQLCATGRALGWDLDRELARGMIDIVFIPQPEVQIDVHLELIADRVRAMEAKRLCVDSLSVLLHRVTDPQVSREKVFLLASLVRDTGAVGFFSVDIPYGANRISRFGVEETVVDGVILVGGPPAGLPRARRGAPRP